MSVSEALYAPAQALIAPQDEREVEGDAPISISLPFYGNPMSTKEG